MNGLNSGIQATSDIQTPSMQPVSPISIPSVSPVSTPNPVRSKFSFFTVSDCDVNILILN